MNRQGFTLVELLGCLALLGIVLAIGLYSSNEMMTTSLVKFRNVHDDEVFSSALEYVNDKDLSGNIYVSVINLIDLGYINDMNDTKIRNKCVFVNKKKDKIKEIKFVDSCK